jgi:hypothetical protein
MLLTQPGLGQYWSSSPGSPSERSLALPAGRFQENEALQKRQGFELQVRSMIFYLPNERPIFSRVDAGLLQAQRHGKTLAGWIFSPS